MVNAFMTTAIRAGVSPKPFQLLTTSGRKSGQRRTTPVTLVASNGTRWLVSPYGNVSWVHNVRANNTVALRRGRHTETLTAEAVDSQTAGLVLQQYLREVPITAPYFDAVADDPVARFVEEAPRHPVFRLVSNAR